MLDAWQSSDPYSDSTAQSIGYAMLKDNTVWSSGFNNIVFKKNGIYWETLTGSNTYTGYKYLAQTCSSNCYYSEERVGRKATIYSGQLLVTQSFGFANGTRNIFMNVGKSKYYSYGRASETGQVVQGVFSVNNFVQAGWQSIRRNFNISSTYWYRQGLDSTHTNAPYFYTAGLSEDCGSLSWTSQNLGASMSYPTRLDAGRPYRVNMDSVSGVLFLFNWSDCS